MTQEGNPIVLGQERLSESQKADYKRKIDAAKGGLGAIKGNEPVGFIERKPMPNINEVRAQAQAMRPPDLSINDGHGPKTRGVEPRPPGSPIISKETEAKLGGFIKAAQEIQDVKTPPLEEAKLKESLKAEEQIISRLFDDAQTEAESILSNKNRRKEIESRLTPMVFEDLISKGEVHQNVPIIPGKFEAVFRSITPEENLFIKEQMSKLSITTESYVAERFGLYQITCALVSINSTVLPNHLDAYGEPKLDLLEEKLKRIKKMSGYIIADLHQNYIWFDLRVRKLFTADALKNG